MTERSTTLSETLKLIKAHLSVWWECSFPGHGSGSAFCLPLTHIDRNRRRDLISALIISAIMLLVIIGIIYFPSGKKAAPPRMPLKTSIVPTPMPPAKKKPPQPTPPDVVTPPLPYIPPPRVVVPPLKNALKEKVTHVKPVKQEQPKPKKIKKKNKKKALTKAPSKDTRTSDDDDDDSESDDSEKNHSAGAVPINGARPEYPPNAEDDNREGKVVASCDILPSGHTANCKIVSHTGGSDFVSSAMDFLARARYAPSVENGVPVTEHGHMLTIDFTLGD